MPVSYSHNQYQGIWTLQQVSAAAGANTWPKQGEYYLAAWGSNRYGQLGDGRAASGGDTWAEIQAPTIPSSTTRWKVITSDQNSSAGIKSDGTLWTWGRNNYGILGQGTLTYYSSPKQVGALTNWLTISSAYNHALAVKTDGTLWSWGRNSDGELGHGNITYYSSPKQVGGLTTWSSVCSSRLCSFAIKTNGTLWVWGRPSFGQLGLGDGVTYYSSPKQVGALTNWAVLPDRGPYQYSMLAIKTDGTLWAWGYGVYGNLGLGNTTSYSSPKQVGALTTWSKVATASFHSLAVKTDGTLWSWGTNSYGNLGLGNTTYYSSPKQVGGLTTWSKVGGTNTSSFAIKTDGTLWSWGDYGYAVLGLGTQRAAVNISSPSQVGSGTDWYFVTASQQHVLALKNKSV